MSDLGVGVCLSVCACVCARPSGSLSCVCACDPVTIGRLIGRVSVTVQEGMAWAGPSAGALLAPPRTGTARPRAASTDDRQQGLRERSVECDTGARPATRPHVHARREARDVWRGGAAAHPAGGSWQNGK
jgi:hypothetical protein